MKNAAVITTSEGATSTGAAHTIGHLIHQGRRLIVLAILSSLLLTVDTAISAAASNPLHLLFKLFKRSQPSRLNIPAQFDHADLKQYTLTQALRQRPDDAALHYQLGQVYEQSDRWEQAAQAYRVAVRLSPRWADAHYRLGLAYERLGTFECHGEVLIDRNKLNQAITEYRNAIRLDPTHQDAHYQLSLAYQTKGQFALAIRECQAMLRVDPQYYRARQLVQTLYEEYLADHPQLARKQHLAQTQQQQQQYARLQDAPQGIADAP